MYVSSSYLCQGCNLNWYQSSTEWDLKFQAAQKCIIALYNDTVTASVIKWANLDTSQG